MGIDYGTHHGRFRKGDMMKIAAPEKRVREIFLGVGGDDDHRSVLRRDDFVRFNDVELHLVEHIKHVVLKVAVRLVDLVDKQYAAVLRGEGLADLAHLYIVADIGNVAVRVAEPAVVEPGQRIILIQRFNQLHA